MLASHLLLAVSFTALAAASLRVVSSAAPEGLVRLVAAAPVAAAMAALHSLVLGLAGLARPVPLALAALATWAGARALSPEPEVPLSTDLERRWQDLGPREQIALGALGGLWLAATAFWLRYPAVGIDGLYYNLPEVIAWVQDGSAGGVVDTLYAFPTGNYPLTNEVLLAWGMSISGSFVWATVWTPLCLVLAAASGWLVLRDARIPRWASALALGALFTIPSLVESLKEPETDTSALAWALCAAALASGARRSPMLLAPMLVAAFLAAGTKTTALPLAAGAALAGLYLSREHVRRLGRPLALAAAGGIAVGGFWYLRNLVDHGTPFWPFQSVPWGTPRPEAVELLGTSLLDDPGAVGPLLDDYAYWLAGGGLLLLGAVAAPLLARRREVAVAAGLAVLSTLLWASAPATGVSDFPELLLVAPTSVRYLLPGLAIAAFAVALVTKTHGRASVIAGAVLVAAIAWNLGELTRIAFPGVPSAASMLIGVAAGALTAALAARRLPPAPVALGAAILATGVAFAGAADGYVGRHTEIVSAHDRDLVRFFEEIPGLDGDIRFSALMSAMLAGDDLDRRLELIPSDTSCPEIRRLAAGGLVVVGRPTPPETKLDPVLLNLGPARRCRISQRPIFESYLFAVYDGRGP